MSNSPTSGPWSVKRRVQRPFSEAMGAERYRQALQEEFRTPESQAWLESELGELLFDAYKEARINGRNSYAQVSFERDLGHNLAVLRRELLDGSYKPRRCIVFTVDRPVKREVVAPAFRDMVVGHLLCAYLSPIFERRFIADSYSCRKGKGTSYGINRLEHHIRSVTQNYTREGWVLQLDLRGFFMSIDQCILYDRVMGTLTRGGHRADAMYPLAALLVRVTIFTDPTVGCHVRGKREDWDGLPASKSLFNCPPGRGLPIGHLTSQLFSNVYLDPLDQFVKRALKARHYGRYVDDFYFITYSRQEALALVEPIRVFLLEELHLTLHPRKIRLKRAVQGVQFLGVVVRPGRRILCHRAHALMMDSLLVALTFFDDIHLIGARLRSYQGYLLDKCARQLTAAVFFAPPRARERVPDGQHLPQWASMPVLELSPHLPHTTKPETRCPQRVSLFLPFKKTGLEDFAAPEHLEEVQDIDYFDVFDFPRNRLQRHENKPAIRVLFFKSPQACFVFGLYLFGRFDFDGYLGIPQNDINLLFVICTPVRDAFLFVVVPFVCYDFLHHEVLESMPVVIGSTGQGMSAHQIVGEPHVKVIEPGSLNYLSFHRFPICGYFITYQCII